MRSASSRHVTFDADDIYKAIVDHQIAFDMHQGLIWESSEAVIFRDQAALEFYSMLKSEIPTEPVRKRGGISVRHGGLVRVDGESASIQLLGASRTILERSDGSLWRMTSQAFYQGVHDGWITVQDDRDEDPDDIWSVPVKISEKAIARGLFREQEIEQYKTDKSLCTTPFRTIQRWMHALKEAGTDFRAQEEALAGHEDKRGRHPRIPEWQIRLIYEVVKEVLNNHDACSLLRGWREFVKRCKANTDFAGPPCSYPTFCRYVLHYRLLDVRKREGNRVAENVRPITWHADVGEPVHGMRPLAVVHIDSTQLNLHARHPVKTMSLGRPWLTVAYDGHSRKVLAAFISFRKPSYASTMMVFRALILKTKGLAPELLLMDGGPEFRNKNLQRLLEHYRVQARWRKKPRQGCVIERLFGVSQQQFFHDLAGNSKFMVRVRQMTKETFPEKRVSWTLTAIYYGFDFYADEIYGETPHPELDANPNEYFSARLFETGRRAVRIIPFDRTFLIETCPEVSGGGTRVVHNVRGIFVEGVWFHGPVLRRRELHGKRVPVKIDWWDPRMVYVLDPEGAWHTCFSKHFDRLATATQAERKSAWLTLKQRTGRGKHSLDEEIQERYLFAYEAENFDPILRTQEDEARRLYNGLNMTVADVEAWKSHYGRTMSPPKPAAAKPSRPTAGQRLKFSRPSRFDSAGEVDPKEKDERA